MANYVIYDCDCGIDDAWGLLMLLKGEKHTKSGPDGNGFKVLAVTTVHGNAGLENVTKNTLRILDAADRLDIPLHMGCGRAIVPSTWINTELFHGHDGFGDVKFEKEMDLGLVNPKHAVNAMYEYVCKYPKKVDFILVGPLTNFATCIIMYGDDFLSKVGRVFVMGGNFRGKGNATKSAEYNFMCDPEAANIVLENVEGPITIVPWETCIDGDLGLTLDWRFEVIGRLKTKPVQVLNQVEEVVLKKRGFVKWLTCDALLVSTYVFPDLAIVKSRLYPATVELTGTHTRGQMVLDHRLSKTSNLKIVIEIHKDNYRTIIAWTAGVSGFEINL